ncbi:7-deoxyloganetin glucosyltransferase-like isoform X1 [Prunus yedoensis var. nudiflora]|uniref:Glycosyltransferase n=1 Tax=Prunus yedoensis var. nudiflora TaxID=2094558 RepID=A0A314U9Z0_PRUYE|nr:7-deoxyloganetin glucosyltransferase-like isoform X1 [Prunus yedoensis var. nudiflora]
MGSTEVATKPHAVCIPAPAQSHIKAMLKFAKLLHHRGFHITFVNTEFNHKRFLKSLGSNSLDGLPDFRFEAIPDSLPDSNEDTTPDFTLLVESIKKNFLAPFHALLLRLNNDPIETSNNPPVTCIVSDGFMSTFTITAAEKIGAPIVLFNPIAACSFMGFKQLRAVVEKGLAPLKDESCFTNGYLDTVIDWIPGMRDIRLRDLPTFLQTTNPDDVMFNFIMEATDRAHEASAVVLHTFDALESDVLDALSSMPPRVYTVGPLQLHLNHIPEHPLKMGYSLWKEETECLEWLNTKGPNSVVYANFGSVAVMTPERLLEFGWGLANSKLPFFGSLIAGWCPQEQVLNHPSVGGFLTHSGWNSTVESLTAGVPMLCWPCFGDQQMDCRYTCNEWGIGMEISNDVKRDEVEKLVKELMEAEKGKKMKNKVIEWKKLAEEATGPHGSSSTNLDNLVNQVLLRKS